MKLSKIVKILLAITFMTTTVSANEYSNTGSGSGGFGGGGVITNELPANIMLAESQINNCRFNETSTYNFVKPNLSVFQVIIMCRENELDITIREELLKDISSRVTIRPESEVFEYFNIYSSSNRLNGAIIRFKVNSNWIVKPVSLVKWDGSKWTTLETKKLYSDEIYDYYEAYTDTFSRFAIVGINETIGDYSITPKATSVPESTSIVDATPTRTVEKSPGFETILILIAISILFLYNRRI